MKKLIAWLVKTFPALGRLFGASEPAVVAPPAPTTPSAAPTLTLVPHVAYNYEADARDYANEYELQRYKFYNGLPSDYDLVAFATAGGRPNPYTHDTRGSFIQPEQPFPNTDALVNNGEMDIKVGQTKTATLTSKGRITWVAHAPQYHGSCLLMINGAAYGGAYIGYDLPPGTYSVALVEGPSQGLRVSLRTPNA